RQQRKLRRAASAHAHRRSPVISRRQWHALRIHRLRSERTGRGGRKLSGRDQLRPDRTAEAVRRRLSGQQRGSDFSLNILSAEPPYAPRCASDLARILASVVIGVIASGSILSRMIEGLPDACACLNAAGNSAVFSTSTPKPPKARA